MLSKRFHPRRTEGQIIRKTEGEKKPKEKREASKPAEKKERKSAPAQDKPLFKLYCYHENPEEITKAFGELKDVNIVPFKGGAVLKFTSEDNAKAAKDTFEKNPLKGATLQDTPKPREYYRAFCLAEDYDQVLDYFLKVLSTPVEKLERPQNSEKKHAFLLFKTLDDCRKARSAFREKPMDKVIVRPFYSRNNRRRHH